MKLEVVQHGAAVLLDDGRTIPLRALLPLRALRARRLTIRTASLAAGRVEIVTSDGVTRRSELDRTPPECAELIVENIGQLLTLEGPGVGALRDARIACRAGRVIEIVDGGRPLESARSDATVTVDARGGVTTPGLVEPHAHPVFAGERSLEFALKADGRSYLEIHNAGGGILSTVRSTRAASFDGLADRCAANLERLLAWGVTTCEGKSGYALETVGELRLLEVMRTVSGTHPVSIVPTLLGAHALPPERAASRDEYVREVAEEMVPRAARDGLARYCDAYCEEGAFTVDEVERILRAARAAGLGLRLHAEQFSDQGGAALAARLGAASADHLEAISEAGIAALAAAGTTAVLLPGAALACRCPWPPARALSEAGVPIALGTDLNPGSSMTAALPLMMSIACMQLGMSCEQVWRAVTVEPARSLGRPDLGRVAVGCPADLAIFDAPDYRYVPYHYGENHLRAVIKDGQLVHERGG
jgi:imidazolonepropionase